MTSYRIRRPDPTLYSVPLLLYDSPHSGRRYPADFETCLERVVLRRAEDAYVDELLAGTTKHGAVILDAICPRCIIDVNRAETDIDESLLRERWPGKLVPTDKSKRGLGLLRRFVTPGVEIHSRLLEISEVRDRIENSYRPYHEALDELVDEIMCERGFVWHINWHSMKSVGNAMTPDGAGAKRPDFVVSNRDGQSASAELTEWIVGALRSFGYTVSLNHPYKGGTIVERLGAPSKGIHSLQIEINRALYLDEERVETHRGFSVLANNIETFTAGLSALATTGR
jgi:N-formylglutamate deformylase